MATLQAVQTNGAMPQPDVPKPKSKITSIEPWHEEVGPEILEEISSELTNRIYLDDGKALLAITWVAHANMFADFDVTPRLAITAPSSECGKSTLSNALLAMTDNCLGSEALTDAAFIRYAARGNMVFHWDEADETFNRYSKGKDITKALNGGWESGGAFHKCSGDDHEPTEMPTHAAVALIGKNLEKSLPSATLSRCLILHMQRSPRGFHIWRKRKDLPVFEELGRKLVRWIQDNRKAIANYEPTYLDALSSRENDKWASLLAIAEYASPDLGRRLRAYILSSSKFSNEDIEMKWLKDVNRVCNLGYWNAPDATNKGIAPEPLAQELAALTDEEDSAFRFWENYNPPKGTALTRIRGDQVTKFMGRFEIEKRTIRFSKEDNAMHHRQNFDGFRWDEIKTAVNKYIADSYEAGTDWEEM